MINPQESVRRIMCRQCCKINTHTQGTLQRYVSPSAHQDRTTEITTVESWAVSVSTTARSDCSRADLHANNHTSLPFCLRDCWHANIAERERESHFNEEKRFGVHV